jgi:ABC-type multidrug transport system fused ATPase/permease subunit
MKISVLGFIRPEWRFFAIGTIGSVLLAIATTLLPPVVVRPLFETVLGQKQFEILPQLLLLTALILGVSSAALYLQDAFYGIGAAKFGARMRAGVFKALIRAEVRLGLGSAERSSQAALDVRELELFYATELTAIIGQGLVMIAVAIALLISSPLLTIGLVVVLVPLVFFSNWLAQRLETALAEAQREAALASGMLSEALSKLEVVKAFRAEDKLETRFSDVNARTAHAMSRRSSLGALNAPLAQLTAGAGIVALLGLGVLEVQTGRMSLGALTSYLTQLGLGLAPIQIFARSYGRLAAVRAPAKNLQMVLESPAEIETSTNQTVPSGTLELQQVSASYESNIAFEKISLRIPKGSFTAIIGASGSGKTTLTRIFLRLLEPSQGIVSLGGQNMPNFTRAAWRSAFAYVPQNPSLFMGTIRSNLCLARDTTDQELWFVLQQVGLDQEISSLDTILGENGTGLSGGQLQRLAIARALITQAEILIFDEPTSSLDAVSEQHIKVLLESLRGTKTLIVIAHRLTTIEKADQVVELEYGRIKLNHQPALEQKV